MRQTEVRLEQLRHQVGLKHSDLQRRFLLALTTAAGLFLYVLRSELPEWTALLACAALAWAWLERRGIQRLSRDAHSAGEAHISELDDISQPEGSGARGVNQR